VHVVFGRRDGFRRAAGGPPIPLSDQEVWRSGGRRGISNYMRTCLLAVLSLPLLLNAGDTGARVRYAGGTVAGIGAKSELRIGMADADNLRIECKAAPMLIPFRDVTTLEYGLHVSRRYVEAVLISPVFLLAKKKSHFLTIGYTDGEGNHQAMVLEVGSGDIRGLLVSLEARTGRRVEYQDEEARKAGKG